MSWVFWPWNLGPSFPTRDRSHRKVESLFIIAILKRPWCRERLKVGEGGDRGWDGWMASPTQWTWVWASSRSWWWTGRPGVLQSMGSCMCFYATLSIPPTLSFPTVSKSLLSTSASPLLPCRSLPSFWMEGEVLTSGWPGKTLLMVPHGYLPMQWTAMFYFLRFTDPGGWRPRDQQVSTVRF